MVPQKIFAGIGVEQLNLRGVESQLDPIAAFQPEVGRHSDNQNQSSWMSSRLDNRRFVPGWPE
jgi:hypothetical protein